MLTRDERMLVLLAQQGDREALNSLLERAVLLLHYQEECPLEEISAIRAERNYKLAFLGAVVLEGVFLALFLFLADFTNRLHVLLLLATVMTYSILAIGLVALGAHVNRAILRVLKAISES